MDSMCADLLVDILRRLPPRGLAASRCICKAWHAIIDDHRLLRGDLLPLQLDGIIYWTTGTEDAPRLFARRSTALDVAGCLGYLDGKKRWSWPMYNSCNGVVLLHGHVVNPATRQWAPLPPVPCTCSLLPPYGGCAWHYGNRYIAYDPTVSPHYKVLLIPDASDHVPVSTAEWPPPSYIVRVFSSKSMCWKERPFVRQGDAAGTAADMERAPLYLFHSAYWQGALYVPRKYGFILRINLSGDGYQVIKFPRGNKGGPRLGKSMEGVYCALNHGISRCEVWFLDESCGRMEWVLKNEINLQPAVTKYSSVHVEDGPWILQSRRQMEKRLLKDVTSLKLGDGNNQALSQDDFEWDSDDENMIDTADLPPTSDNNSPHYVCLGFHPYKEIVLFCWSNKIVACHLNSSKIRYLGKAAHIPDQMLVACTYAPCWMRDLPGST